jgi:hypothetical protein
MPLTTCWATAGSQSKGNATSIAERRNHWDLRVRCVTMINVSPEPDTSSFGTFVDAVATDLDRDQPMS